MPVEDKDHMSWMGFGEKTTVLFRYYEDMLELFRHASGRRIKEYNTLSARQAGIPACLLLFTATLRNLFRSKADGIQVLQWC